jgi:hypothetical protein
MANETARNKIADKLADIIAPGADGNTLAEAMRSAAKIVVLTQTEYDALTPDEDTIYLITE